MEPEPLRSLQVRLLTGIGRYDEMTYVFDLLHQNHRFEMLLRKKVDVERGQVGLRFSELKAQRQNLILVLVGRAPA